MQRQVTEALDRSDKNNLEVSEALRECKALCAKAETAAGCGISDSQDEAAKGAGMADLRMHFEGEIAALKKVRQNDCTAVAGLRAQSEGDITALRKELSRIGAQTSTAQRRPMVLSHVSVLSVCLAVDPLPARR